MPAALDLGASGILGLGCRLASAYGMTGDSGGASFAALGTNGLATLVSLGGAAALFPSLVCFVLLFPAALGAVGLVQGIRSRLSTNRETVQHSAEVSTHLALLNGSLLGIGFVILLVGTVVFFREN